MFNDEETANIVTLLNDLQTDLRNGNVPAAQLLIISLANNLTIKQPLEWRMLGSFINDHLDKTDTRVALLHMVPIVRELICPIQPDQDASKEC